MQTPIHCVCVWRFNCFISGCFRSQTKYVDIPVPGKLAYSIRIQICVSSGTFLDYFTFVPDISFLIAEKSKMLPCLRLGPANGDCQVNEQV